MNTKRLCSGVFVLNLRGGSGELFHKTRGKMSSCLCLGIEDTFRTAATEVSLLAGSEEFNATKLFEVGKNFPPFLKSKYWFSVLEIHFAFAVPSLDT